MKKRGGAEDMDLSLTQSDINSLKMRVRTTKNNSARKLDRKGRYMKDILKTSECFEHFFS